MTDYRWFVIDVNPEPWAVGPVGMARRGGKLTAYVGRNAQLHAFQETVKDALGSDHTFLEGKLSLRLVFWRERAEYETPQARTHRKHEADLTNCQKAFEDALQEVLFKNDKDVIDIHSTMVDQGPDVRGRIVLGIKVIERDHIDLDMPQSVWDLLEAMDKPAEVSDNSWPPKGSNF